MGIVFPLLICSLLPVWAAETVALRRPRLRAVGWRLAWVSITLAAGLLIAGRRVDVGYSANDQLSALERGLWVGWVAGNLTLIIWAYAGRPSVESRGFPVVPAPREKIVAKSDSGVGRGPGGPI